MGLKAKTEKKSIYELPKLNEPYKGKQEELPQKYIQAELPLENVEPSSKKETIPKAESAPMMRLTPEEKIASAKKRRLSEPQIKAIEYIVSNEQPKTIEIGKQNKHIPGTNEYKQKVEQNKRIGQKTPGTLSITIEKVQELVNLLHGTGVPQINNEGKFANREYVAAPYPIGYVETSNGIEQTNYFTIHYSKKGVHIVPRYKNNED